MRITFVMDGGDSLSGGHRAIAMFAQGLMRLGHQVTLVARPQRRLSLRDRIRKSLQPRRAAQPPAGKLSHFRAAGVPLKVLSEWRPVENRDVPDADVVVATWWETVEWVANLAPSKGNPAHFMQDYETWGGRVDEVDRSCLAPLPKIVAIDWVKDLLITRFHQTPVAMIPYGIDHEIFCAPERGKQAVPTVGLTYSVMHNKGTDVSLQAYRLARAAAPDLRLIVTGATGIIPELPIPEGACVAFWQTDLQLQNLYSQCDAWLFGTRREGFGLPILEAMSCRTPVIGTPAGAGKQLLGDGAGVLIKPEDPEGMAEAIVKLCRLSDSEWRALSEAAHARAALYTWPKAAGEFESALVEIVENAAPRVAPQVAPRVMQ
jgi:glycosyltransferase involved in cell wall biosynthesis